MSGYINCGWSTYSSESLKGKGDDPMIPTTRSALLSNESVEGPDGGEIHTLLRTPHVDKVPVGMGAEQVVTGIWYL